jgi:hypothetical protein
MSLARCTWNLKPPFLNMKRSSLYLGGAIFLLLIFGHISTEAQPSQDPATLETIINKQDADHIFSLNRAGWEQYAQRMVHPAGWKMRLSRHDTGTTVMAFDQKTGIGLSIQPLYYGDDSQPGSLVVGSYYPPGSLRPFDPEMKKRLEQAATKDLGAKYVVSASYVKMPKFEGIELTVSLK